MLAWNSCHTIRAWAPATCANLAVGFDCLGLALEGPGDRVTLTRRDDRELVITDIINDPGLPREPEKNLATAVIKQFLEDYNLEAGFSVAIEKGISLGSGMGGSAASSVAALTALNGLLAKPMPLDRLLMYALQGEALASGSAHADNVAPALYGGVTLVTEDNRGIALPVPSNLCCVIVHPHQRLDTREARAVLSPQVNLADHVAQSSRLAQVVAGFYTGDMSLLRGALIDTIIEPARAALIPGFYAVKQAALDAGALGTSISGGGPSVFALVDELETAHTVADAMQGALTTEGIESDQWVSKINTHGAVIESM